MDFLNNKINGEVFKQHKKELIEAGFNKEIDFDVPKYIATIRNYFTDVVKKHKSTYRNIKGNPHA